MTETPKHAFAWHRGAGALLALALLASCGPLSVDSVFDRSGTYAGVLAGAGLTHGRLVDVEGFANWGNPGSVAAYDSAGIAGGALAGKKFAIGGVPLRAEIAGIYGDLSAQTNRLDPEGLDETAESEFRWIATMSAGVERTFGPVTLFATGGAAAAHIANSVTDLDSGDDMRERVDPDDSFLAEATEIGWTAALGFETPLGDAWTLRLGGSYLDFGRSPHHVNRSGDNSCGPDGPRRACLYEIGNRLGIVSLAIIRRFGR